MLLYECFGLEPGHPLTFEMNTAIRRIGFDKVFDTNFTADLTIIEEGTELLLRLYKALVEKDGSAVISIYFLFSRMGKIYRTFLSRAFASHVKCKKSATNVWCCYQNLLRKDQ